MLKFLLALSLVLNLNAASALADDASKRIEKAVDIFAPLAQSGVTEHKVKKARTVKEMLYALAIKEGYSESEEDFSWVGKSGDAWEADSTNFGETTMKAAYDYITQLDDTYEEYLNEEGNEAEKAKVLKQVKAAKDGFKLLLNTGVMFGVAPMGAVQCGVTFAALAIIDPKTGKIYLFAKEGSGC